MAQRPITRWFYTWNIDGGYQLDANGLPALSSQADVDAMYLTDLYFTFTGRYVMPTDGVYQVHFRVDRVSPSSDLYFQRKLRFTKDSTQFPVIRGEQLIGSDWIPLNFIVPGSAGVDVFGPGLLA